VVRSALAAALVVLIALPAARASEAEAPPQPALDAAQVAEVVDAEATALPAAAPAAASLGSAIYFPFSATSDLGLQRPAGATSHRPGAVPQEGPSLVATALAALAGLGAIGWLMRRL
jgi:hypothetical protein